MSRIDGEEEASKAEVFIQYRSGEISEEYARSVLGDVWGDVEELILAEEVMDESYRDPSELDEEKIFK